VLIHIRAAPGDNADAELRAGLDRMTRLALAAVVATATG
jgi:hypothetical protein